MKIVIIAIVLLLAVTIATGAYWAAVVSSMADDDFDKKVRENEDERLDLSIH